jgi:hypothetical protein
MFSGEGMINLLSSQSPLELLRQASLLQNSISRVARFDFTIYGETTVCHGAIPYLMVAAALPFKVTAVLQQDLSDSRGVIRHFWLEI